MTQSHQRTVIICKGHPNIRATHAKTFELTTDDTITQTGTCIIGVQCAYDEDALFQLRGRVRITLKAGELEDIVLARINPSFRRGDPLIFRRNDKTQPRTFCTSASKGSSGLDRDLINALQKEDAELQIVIEALDDDQAVEGVLYVVGMPIGNMADLSLRALDTLQSVDAILCEDTRTTRQMLSDFGISAELISYHDHNERSRVQKMIERLQSGGRLAIVSEAGMPLISDPGYHIVSAAVEEGLEVVPVPGPDAVTTALSISGVSPTDFRFVGFMPRKSGARKKIFEEIKRVSYTLVFFESPHRIIQTMEDIKDVLGGRHVVVCRDMTKHTQDIYRGASDDIIEVFSQMDQPRGELTVLVQGVENDEVPEADGVAPDHMAFVQALVDEGCPTKLLAKALAQTTGMKRRDAFAMVVEMKGEEGEE